MNALAGDGPGQEAGRAQDGSFGAWNVEKADKAEKAVPGQERYHPTPAELAEALASRTSPSGAVPAGIARQLEEEKGWGGRVLEVLEVLTGDVRTMGYLAGGRRPDEVETWLAVWVESPLSLEEIRMVVPAGGWDPEPFAVIAKAGLLGPLLYRADGTPRRIRGELAGAWVSDQLALASDAEVLRQVSEVIAKDAVPSGLSEG